MTIRVSRGVMYVWLLAQVVMAKPTVGNEKRKRTRTTSFSMILSTISFCALCIITSCGILENEFTLKVKRKACRGKGGNIVKGQRYLSPYHGITRNTSINSSNKRHHFNTNVDTAHNKQTKRQQSNSHRAVGLDHHASLSGSQLVSQGFDLVLVLTEHRIL